MSDITFFLPTRKGSQRVKDKNTKPFSNFSGGILELKLRQLISSQCISQIILSTNDDVSMKIADEINIECNKIKVVRRPDELCLSTTPLVDLIEYVPSITDTEHVIWGHTTTPFITSDDYDRAIEKYFDCLSKGYDSLVSVHPFQNFLIEPDSKQIFNTHQKQSKWPRTQDLPILFEVNHGMFITSCSIYKNKKDRIGSNPYLYEMDRIRSFDIDWEDDFTIAEAIYEKIFRK
ncbi:acylneuraminate cytidylyltransferase family protein [Fulvivirga ulvae]|uniref:acylneuraminate cytidylyltransferase family protein n=1 Tax=Fulvivirga ulvae TaxID=2904245 RepID=UPI001F397EA3|nr:acylneuraminate cytidylyltransferase family protein [Fulvivirga ulvae]UII31659.1 acylneuraminate cytidylyltransferase family protein [Fulvivirga ulvae]